MPKVEILPDVLASQVAAGEVVERPASVVKEMVENAIDAGAKHIEIEIHKGGTSLIKITDDGCGMAKEDALMSLERHATSKLKTSAELASIATMGFRGEAVPSIASVSRLRIATQEQSAVEGTEIIVEAGIVREVKVIGMQSGTVFEIKNLFYNVPARRKFLRAETTESAHVEHQVKLHALAYPEVRFTYRKDARLVFDAPATTDRRTRIACLSGSEVAKSLIEIPLTNQFKMTVLGYILPAQYARKGRRQQFVFLNGRPIEDSSITRAIKDGFKEAVIENLNPTAWLWITMDPALVDVNVHPAKKEVRFHKPYDVRSLVCSAVENRKSPQLLQPTATQKTPAITPTLRGEPKIISRKSGDVSPVHQTVVETVEVKPEKVITPNPPKELPSERPQKVTPSRKFPNTQVAQQEELDIEEVARPVFRSIGILHQKYILLEGEEGLVLLEPKAARERIVYEQVMQEVEKNGCVQSQGLLVPEVLDLDSRDLDIVLSNLENFSEAGFEIEPFGGGSIQIRSLPNLIKIDNPLEFITKIIDELIDTQGGRRSKQVAFELFSEALARRVARYETVKIQNTELLLDALFTCDLPYCTPVGKPTLIQISSQELEKKFQA